MANDRLFIRCTVCNRAIMIAKYYPSCIGILQNSAAKIEQFSNFLDRHLTFDGSLAFGDGEACQPSNHIGWTAPMVLVFDNEDSLPRDCKVEWLE